MGGGAVLEGGGDRQGRRLTRRRSRTRNRKWRFRERDEVLQECSRSDPRGVRVRRGTSRHVFNAVASRHPRRRRLRSNDDGNDDINDNDDNTRLPMQLPLTLRRCCLPRRELRGGGGGLSVVAAVTSENVCQRR